jgi:hypothetical protein
VQFKQGGRGRTRASANGGMIKRQNEVSAKHITRRAIMYVSQKSEHVHISEIGQPKRACQSQCSHEDLSLLMSHRYYVVAETSDAISGVSPAGTEYLLFGAKRTSRFHNIGSVKQERSPNEIS